MLVLFSEHVDGGWVVCGGNLPSNESLNYFLCLPQHKEACLHWLNGGDISNKASIVWRAPSKISWCIESPWMDGSKTFNIKPRKEKRWIAIDVKNGDVCLCTESSAATPNYQIVEIEVEVQP